MGGLVLGGHGEGGWPWKMSKEGPMPWDALSGSGNGGLRRHMEEAGRHLGTKAPEVDVPGVKVK